LDKLLRIFLDELLVQIDKSNSMTI